MKGKRIRPVRRQLRPGTGLISSNRKYKIPNYQSGHAYLTSHRVCYVDGEEPRRFSVAIELRDVDRVEYQVRKAILSSHY